MLEGDRQSAETLRMASVKPDSRLMESVPIPAFARLKCFYAIPDEGFDDRAYPIV